AREVERLARSHRHERVVLRAMNHHELSEVPRRGVAKENVAVGDRGGDSGLAGGNRSARKVKNVRAPVLSRDATDAPARVVEIAASPPRRGSRDVFAERSVREP